VQWDPPLAEPRSGPVAEAERRRLLPGRAPFIVPPTSTKAGFYDNPLTREIWTRAHEAIRHADRPFFVGYSFPLTDVSVSGLIVDALGNRPNRAEVHIVDLQPEPVRTRLETMGINPVTDECKEDCVEVFVAKYVDEASRHVVEHLQKWKLESTPGAVRVAWGTERSRYAMNWILDMSRGEGSRTILGRVVGPDEAPSTTTPMLLDRFLNLLDGADRIVLDVEGRQSAIVDCRARPQRRGADGTIDSWHLDLIPAGAPPPGWIQSSPVSHMGPFP
jgi:hypothetical protein